MNLKKINIIFLFTICFANLTTAIGQLCVPTPRLMDRQVVTSSGDILLLRTNFNGTLMDVYNNHKTFGLNYVLISQDGKIKKDTTLELIWDERHYDYLSCKASYKQESSLDIPYTKESDCVLYFPFSQNDKTILAYFFENDRKFAYEIVIDKNGNGKWILYNLDKKENPNNLKYSDDFTKYVFFKNYYLDKKYSNLNQIPTEQFEFFNEKTKIKIKNIDIELNENTDKKWTVNGENWEILLDGDIFYSHYSSHYPSPLINIKDDVMYITVFNKDSGHCFFLGPDIFPITYAIDIKERKIKWEQEIKIK